MFPTQSQSLTTATTQTGKKTFNFDFETGEFILADKKPAVIKGIEALKIRVKKVLATRKETFKIYDTDNTEKYGVTLIEYLAMHYSFEYIKSQIQTEITDSLMQDSEINSIYDFSFTRSQRTLTVTFSMSTAFGTISEVIKING